MLDDWTDAPTYRDAAWRDAHPTDPSPFPTMEVATMPTLDDRLASKALTFLGVLAIVALAGALWLTAQGHDATVAWATATGAIGTIGGILVPRS